MLTSRFFLFLPDGSPVDGGLIRQMTDTLAVRGLRGVLDRPAWLFASGTAGGSSRRPARDGHLLDVWEGTRQSPLADRLSAEDLDLRSRIDLATQTVQVFNLVAYDASAVHVSSDPLGVKACYVASLPRGHVVCTDLGDLFACQPDLVRPFDTLALGEFIALGSAMGTRTLHRRVRRLAVGESFHWELGGRTSSDFAGEAPLPSCDHTRSLHKTCEMVHDALRASVQRRTRDSLDPVVVPLSGGFDSRCLAATAVELGVPTVSYTLGRPSHDECRVARVVAKTLGLRHRVLRPGTDILDDEGLRTWLLGTGGQSDADGLFTSLLLSPAHPVGTTALFGYLGDPYGGNHLSWLGREEQPDNTGLARLILGHLTRHMPAFSRPPFERLPSLQDLEDVVASEIRDEGPPYARLMSWDLANRQRRHVATMFNYVAGRFRVAMPYYDETLRQLYLSLPRLGLDQRYVQRAMMRRYFPAVGTIPHDEERPRSIPLDGPGASAALALLGSRALRRIVPRFDSNVWSVWHGTSRQQYRDQLAALPRLLSVIQEVFDVELTLPQRGDHLAQTVAAVGGARGLRRLFLLGHYATQLAGGLQRAP
jgi:hypothetical protein